MGDRGRISPVQRRVRSLGLALLIALPLFFGSGGMSDRLPWGVGPVRGAPAESFSQFLLRFEQVAVRRGVSASVYRSAMGGLVLDRSVSARISGQPEFTTPIWDYLARRVSRARIRAGRAAFARNRALFRRIGGRYGVDPYILAAIWGMETDYGAVLGNRSLIRPILPSLAALVYANRSRREADEGELISALLLVQNGAAPDSLLGSWAGAMGHLQVNPSVVLKQGTDGDGDGRVDVHHSLADALATSAVLLNSFGYVSGLDWGFEVMLPAGFDYGLAGRENWHDIGFFADLGVRRVAGRPFQDRNVPVFLYLPAGREGPKFLMTRNYLVLKAYNFSDSYALSVAHLTDRLKGSGPLVGQWPVDTKFPDRAQRHFIQRRLRELGYYQGEVDGRIGPLTQAAFRKFQQARGLPADGFITLDAVDLLAP